MTAPTPHSLPSSSHPAYHKRQRHHLLGIFLTVFAAVGLSAIGIFVSRQLVSQTQDLNSKAAPTTTLSLTTSQAQPKVGETFTVNIEANTGTNVVKALDINLEYDQNVLQLLDMTKGSWLSQAREVVKTIDHSNGTGLFGLVILPTANPAFVTGKGTAMTATFKALSSASQTTIAFNTPNTLAAAANERQNVVSSYANVSVAVLSNGSSTSPGKQCNESCGNSSECRATLVCDGGKCRRDGNLGDDKCLLPPDKGIQRGCNQYCANDAECGGGLKCWWNQCRLPQNQTDANCQVPPTPMPTAVVTRAPRPTREPTLIPTSTPTPTPARANVSATVRIDSEPSPTKRVTVADFPTQTVPVTQVPAQQPSSSIDFLSWVPAILGIVLVGLAIMLFGPQLKALVNPPKARVVSTPVTTPPPPVRPTSPASAVPTRPPVQAASAAPAQTPVPAAGQTKVHFGTPVDFKVSSKESPKT